MRKLNNKKAFTLAELLIVVAIIAVLVAIAVPVFTNQLERSKESTDLANIRDAYAVAVAQVIETNSPATATAPAAGQRDNAFTFESGELNCMSEGGTSKYSITTARQSGNYTITVGVDGTVSVS